MYENVWVNKWEWNETNEVLINVIYPIKLEVPFRKIKGQHAVHNPQFDDDCLRLFSQLPLGREEKKN